jgi:uncharacterized protein
MVSRNERVLEPAPHATVYYCYFGMEIIPNPCYRYQMEFEYDPEKSAANLAKHGIDFETAKALWNDVGRAQVRSASPIEERWLLIAMLEDRFWTAVFTMRADVIRIISVRRSRENEVKDYVSREEN